MTERTYPAGVTSWIDLEAPDLAAAQAFYGEMLGWTFEVATPPEAPAPYVIARLGGRDVAGLAPRSDGPARWNTYVAVDDAAATAARAVELGGRILSPASAAGDAGVGAAVADPEGTEIRLWQAGRRRGAQVANEPGAWNFSNLATDVADAATFYTDLFGWEFDDVGFGVMIRVPGYGAHLAATIDPGIAERQAEVSVPTGFADAFGWQSPTSPAVPASWHVVFAVADRDASVATAERLGAVALHTEDSDWAHDAVVRDPQGATFTVSQFDPQH
ncbi:Glyoxalase/bleomycin resistance protein/dioxygenase [Beutenbergia cavernae DSM 12333]|uniref:Glyoxalase/bleomycin resistance protein/dioxygenase n=1 Tax=Beutenbergia cavernae (strain ATCC BAA-8 / DSM 12333 / CCUG 43141 / JCM 11478 / NBRC 16432 / NCIMB 13614 / HKI 0122) TaxID=471853 RepID=C5C534_BEUC1|nr:VOC family protein [Beutenbergia cavernae]ACQ82174.1 Glyoxalase/bleomycin resistance protein/dioxygenase [Beutenbergia cavernae DSM 12333]